MSHFVLNHLHILPALSFLLIINTVCSSVIMFSMLSLLAVFSTGVGPLPWLVASEVKPAKFKGSGSSLVVFTNWNASFVITKVFIYMLRSLTNAGTFWLSVACVSLKILVFYCTKIHVCTPQYFK